MVIEGSPRRGAEYSASPTSEGKGLNNQRIAIMGLCSHARDHGGTVRLPETLTDFSAGGCGHGAVPADRVFDMEGLRAWVAEHGWSGSGADCAVEIDWNQAFLAGGRLWEAREEEAFVARYLCAARGAPALRTLAAQISGHLGNDIGYVQLRVEKDWQAYAQMKMAGGRKGFVLTPGAIFEKIANAPETARHRRWFAFCDLSGLPWDSASIKAEVRDRFGMELLFKTDLPDRFALPASSLENASLDFEIGFLAETYVGLVNSTFSSLLHAARLAMAPSAPAAHYLYSGGGDRAVRRTDRGRGRW